MPDTETTACAGAPPWRPRTTRVHDGSIAEALYGLVLATSVIAVSQESEGDNAGRIAVTVLVTSIVFYLAHVYSRILATQIRDRAPLGRGRMGALLRHDLPLVTVTLPLVFILLLGAAGLIRDRTATTAAMLAALVELGAAGVYAARAAGATMWWTLAYGAASLALGAFIVILKILIH